MKLHIKLIFILLIWSTAFADSTSNSISAYPMSNKQMVYFGDQKRNLEFGFYMNFKPNIKYSEIVEDEDIENFSWTILDEYGYATTYDSTVTLNMINEDKNDYNYDLSLAFKCKKLIKPKQWTDRISSRFYMGSSLAIAYDNYQIQNIISSDGHLYSVYSDSLWGYLYEPGEITVRTTATTTISSDIYMGVVGGI